jgi:formylglycine-generating enzyme required for sulfatase activity
MFEIAERAGVSGVYWWGNDTATDYVVSKEDPRTNNGIGEGKSTVPVGLKKANAWGLYDVQGNVLEWCLDDKVDFDDMALRADPFTPAWKSGDKRRTRGAGNRSHHTIDNANLFHSSYRANAELISTASGTVGFRVSFIAD